MTKKDYCNNNKPVAYFYNSFWSPVVHGIEYGINDYVYISECGRYHKCKIYHNSKHSYINLFRRRVSLSDCIRQNIGW